MTAVVKPVSIQLWTVRNEIAELGMEAVLRRIAALGYDGFEPAGLGGLAPARVRVLADELGLKISSAHVQLPAGNKAAAVMDEQEALGNPHLIAGPMPDQVKTLDDVHRYVDACNEAASNTQTRGMTFGLHNHWWEFDTVLEDGRSPHDVMLERLDPSVFFEVDVYWATVGGVDAAGLVASLGARARYLHVKDGPVEPRAPMTAVGAGTVDINAILNAGPEVAWHVVELDEYDGDMFEAVDQSRRWLAARA